MDIIQLDENNRCMSANCVYTKEDKTIEYEFKSAEERKEFFKNCNSYVFKENSLVYEPLPNTSEDKEKQEAQLEQMMFMSAKASFLIELPDNEAVKIPLCFDPWVTNKLYKVGDRCECDGKLWKCRQEHTSQENWKPSINTASLWEVIDVEHAGTLEDPIPYDMNMEVFQGKYYLENGKKYKCIRNSGQPLYTSCESLVGNYFERV